MRRVLLLTLLAATLPMPATAAQTSNGTWLLDPVDQNWWCTSNVPSEACHASRPELIDFAKVYPGDTAWNGRAVILVNDWGSFQGPGSEHRGDSPLLFTVPATYAALHGNGEAAYRGVIAPDNGSHWAAKTPPMHLPDGTWLTVVNETLTNPATGVTLKDTYTYILRSSNFADWLYPPPSAPGSFAEQPHVTLLWKSTNEADGWMRAAPLIFPDLSGWSGSQKDLYGFVQYWGHHADGSLKAVDEAVRVELDFDASEYRLVMPEGTIEKPFGAEFPECPFLATRPFCNGIADGIEGVDNQNGTLRATRRLRRTWTGTVQPPDCPDPMIFQGNLDSDPSPGPAQRRYDDQMKVSYDTYFTVGFAGGVTYQEGVPSEVTGTGYHPASFLNSLNGSSVRTYGGRTYYFRTSADRVACREVLNWPYWSGSGVMVFDF